MSESATMQQRIAHLEEIVREQELTIRRAKADCVLAHQRARRLATQLKACKQASPSRKQ